MPKSECVLEFDFGVLFSPRLDSAPVELARIGAKQPQPPREIERFPTRRHDQSINSRRRRVSASTLAPIPTCLICTPARGQLSHEGIQSRNVHVRVGHAWTHVVFVHVPLPQILPVSTQTVWTLCERGLCTSAYAGDEAVCIGLIMFAPRGMLETHRSSRKSQPTVLPVYTRSTGPQHPLDCAQQEQGPALD
jgi:hypothetical protein